MSITKFDTGAIRDDQGGKEDYIETISWTAFKRYAQYMTGKKAKYGAGNFKKGIPIESYEQSMVRHIQKYLSNKYEDGQIEKNEDHLSAILFNVFGIIHEEERQKALHQREDIGGNSRGSEGESSEVQREGFGVDLGEGG